MHSVQIQNAAIVEAVQAVRGFSFPSLRCIAESICSFELGGEKKTKGAALTFVRHLSHTVPLGITNSTEFLVSICYVVLLSPLFSHHHTTNMICVYMPCYHC